MVRFGDELILHSLYLFIVLEKTYTVKRVTSIITTSNTLLPNRSSLIR